MLAYTEHAAVLSDVGMQRDVLRWWEGEVRGCQLT